MTFEAADFAHDTDFERFALDLLGLHRIRVGGLAAIYHDAKNPAGSVRITVSIRDALDGGRAHEQLRESLGPLGFAAAYKILDLLVEHVLRANDVRSVRRFTEKSRALAQRPVNRPPPLDLRPDLWDRLAAVYLALQEARHAVTHRRSQVTASGDLEVYDNGRALIDTIARGELAAFAASVHAIAEAVIESDSDPRRMNIAAWHLNTLQPRHGLPALSATDANTGRRLLIADLNQLGDGLVRFDAARAREIIAGQPPGVWDLELRADDRNLLGRWEEVPAGDDQASVAFHSASPPSWLSEEVR